MSISAQDVARLRDETGAGMMAAKKALEDSGGDMNAAKELLRKSGAAKAAKRAGRTTGEGVVHSYIHSTGKLGVLVEVQCETDFVARNDDFRALAQQLAMQIAAANPRYIDEASVPADVMDAQRASFTQEAQEGGKPADVVAKIVEGKMQKWLAEDVLMRQEFVMDEGRRMQDVLTEAITKMGENIRVTRFARFNIAGGMSSCEAAPVAKTE